MPFVATWMDLETITLSQKEKDDNHFYVESKKKMLQMNLFTKQK